MGYEEVIKNLRFSILVFSLIWGYSKLTGFSTRNSMPFEFLMAASKAL